MCWEVENPKSGKRYMYEGVITRGTRSEKVRRCNSEERWSHLPEEREYPKTTLPQREKEKGSPHKKIFQLLIEN